MAFACAARALSSSFFSEAASAVRKAVDSCKDRCCTLQGFRALPPGPLHCPALRGSASVIFCACALRPAAKASSIFFAS